jgi:hypothetical protein
MTAVIARIALRYISGALVIKGLLPADSGIATDPDVINLIEVALGLAIGAATEGWYMLAWRMGWSK